MIRVTSFLQNSFLLTSCRFLREVDRAIARGTSLGSPAWAAIIAIADQGRAANGLGSLDGPTQTLPTLYALSSADYHTVTAAPIRPGGGGQYSFGAGGLGFGGLSGFGFGVGFNLGSSTTSTTTSSSATANTQTGPGDSRRFEPHSGSRVEHPHGTDHHRQRVRVARNDSHRTHVSPNQRLRASSTDPLPS